MSPDSPYMNTAMAAKYLLKTVPAFRAFTRRMGIRPDGMAGRIKLYLPASLDKAIRTIGMRKAS